MKDWNEIEKIVFLKHQCDNLQRHELLAVNSLMKLKEQFDEGKISKESATALKGQIRAKYEVLCNIIKLMPNLINMICMCEWSFDNSEEFVKILLNEFNGLLPKTQNLALYQKLGIGVFEYYDDKLKAMTKKVRE